MVEAKEGNLVKVHYTGKLEDGRVFGSSQEHNPLEFKIGEGRIIPGFEKAVVGMKPGETKTTTVPAKDAYGTHDPNQVYVLERKKFPSDLQIGQQYQLSQSQGAAKVVTITNIAPDKVTVDGNHPLAGRDLTFDIELMEVA